MFRRINLKENTDKFILMKNIKEPIGEIPSKYITPIGEIPSKYITNISYNLNDINKMTLEIPDKTTYNGKTVYNPLYDQFKGKRQIIIVNDKEKYVVTECNRQESKNKRVKSIVAESFETTLNDVDFYIGEGGLSRQLYYQEGDYDIAEGILNLVLAETTWKIGNVTEKAKKETNKINETYYKDLFVNLSIPSVSKEKIIWTKDFTDVNPIDDKNVVSLTISYDKIESSKGGKVLKEEKEIHSLGNFHTGIKSITATYSGSDDFRYAIKYTVVTNDNLTSERWCEFTYVDDLDININKIIMSYTTGNVVEKTYTKYRNFETGSYKVYDFITQYIAESFDVRFIFDSYNKTIHCCHISELGEDKGLFFSYDNFIKSINKKDRYEEIVTKLNVESENTSIVEENPTGQSYILDYTYFRDTGIMTEELARAWDRYNTRIDGVQDIIVEKRINLNTLNREKIKIDTQITTIEENIKGLRNIRNAYIKENDQENTARISAEIIELEGQMQTLLQQSDSVRIQIEALREEIKVLVDSITIVGATDEEGRIFTEELLEELDSLTIQSTLNDEYYLTPYTLYNNSKYILEQRNKLQIEFNVDTVGFLQNIIIPKDKSFDYWLTLGDFISIEDDDIMDSGDGRVRIISFNYSPRDNKVSDISFSNMDKDVSELSKLGNIGRSIKSSSNYVNTYKASWHKGQSVNEFVNNMLTNYLDAKAVNIRSRSGRVLYDQSEAGMYIIDALNEQNQIYIGMSSICITNDAWLSVKTCLDENGLVGDTIVGRILCGKNLLIGNESNSFIIDDSGITIESNSLKIKGIDGNNTTFQSYFEMVNNKIALGVKDANNYTDSQITITDKKIEQKVSNSDFNTYKEQTADSISQKVSKGNEFATEFSQNANGFDFKIGNSGTNVQMDKDGQTIRNGALTVTNSNGTVVIDGSSNIFKIYATYEVQLDAGDNLQYEYRIRHGMGYVPAYSAFQVGSVSFVGVSNTMLPALNVSALENTLGFVGIIRANADENDIIITYVRTSTSVYSTPRIKVFVYKERLL